MTSLRQVTFTMGVISALLVLAGCGHAPVRPPAAPPPGAVVAQAAAAMIGVPYRYGGTTPKGFDCSGLAQYAYRRAGITIPRTSREQMRASRTVERAALAVGDLLFFDTLWRSGHVGIYVGNGRFVHAPSTGGRVTYVSLNDPYFRNRLIKAGRF